MIDLDDEENAERSPAASTDVELSLYSRRSLVYRGGDSWPGYIYSSSVVKRETVVVSDGIWTTEPESDENEI